MVSPGAILPVPLVTPLVAMRLMTSFETLQEHCDIQGEYKMVV